MKVYMKFSRTSLTLPPSLSIPHPLLYLSSVLLFPLVAAPVDTAVDRAEFSLLHSSPLSQ